MRLFRGEFLGWLSCLGLFFFSSRRRHTRLQGDWSSDVCSSDLLLNARLGASLRNSHAAGTRGPVFALLDELLGNTRGSAHSAYVSDGGHFENLGDRKSVV